MLNINPLNTQLNPICHLLALLGAHHILHVSRIRVKCFLILAIEAFGGNEINIQNILISETNRDDYEGNQEDATLQGYLLFPVSSTCFGRCFIPSAGALDCIYSFW